MVEYIAIMIRKTDSIEDTFIINEIVRRYPELEERETVINSERPDTNGCNLLTCALSCTKRSAIVRFLLRNGANPNWRTHNGTPAILFRSQCVKTDVDNIAALLAYGADPNTTSPYISILHKILCDRKESIAHVLLKHGASITKEEHSALRRYRREMKILSDFYDHISLRGIALHHIKLGQIVEKAD